MRPVKMTKIALDVPSWMGEAETKVEFFRFLRGEALIKATYYRSMMKPFERKYSTTFSNFKKQIESSPQEDFQAWDDFIEWEAYYRAHQEWAKKYKELKSVQSNY